MSFEPSFHLSSDRDVALTDCAFATSMPEKHGQKPVTVAVWAASRQMVTLACRVGAMSSEAICHWIHAPNVYIHQNSSKPAKKTRHNVQMDYTTGICKLVFKPDHSDLGQWTCRFTLANENAEIEIGSATLVLLNSLGDEKLGWIVGALTAMILFLMIIVVVLVVCKTRIFIRKTPEILETLPPGERERSAQCCDDRYSENSEKIDYRYSTAGSSRASSIESVLPNRSPRVHNRAEKGLGTSKVYENVGL